MNAVIHPNASGPERAIAVQRLRAQVVAGTYRPPVEALVECLVCLLVEPRVPGVVERAHRSR